MNEINIEYCREPCTVECARRADGGAKKGFEENQIIVAHAKENRKTVVSVDKKGFLRWIWCYEYGARTDTKQHSHNSRKLQQARAHPQENIFICGRRT